MRWSWAQSDGRGDHLTLMLRQSSLGTFQMCPEQARLEAVGQLPQRTTDAAALGTAMHSGCEHVLRGGNRLVAAEVVSQEYEAMHDAGIDYVQMKRPQTARDMAVRCFEAWYEHVYPQLPEPLAVEHTFHVPLYQDEISTVTLGGTMDFVGADGTVWDWKTAGRAYEGWEKERWAVQPSAYTYAACLEWPELFNASDPHTFTYAIAIKGSRPDIQILDVTRHAGHWRWLQKQAAAITTLIHTNEDGPWPLIDSGWHCSPKWCPAWPSCKGAELEADDGL